MKKFGVILILALFSLSLHSFASDPQYPQKELFDIQSAILKEKKILRKIRRKEKNKLKDLFYIRRKIKRTRTNLKKSRVSLKTETARLSTLENNLMQTESVISRQKVFFL